ncbi:alanine racemase [Hasllibacter halocynthiae]|nr:alanine racemase [Hasllibacter halocynthiae]
MATGTLHIDLGAVRRNWRALDRLSGGAECGAVVKADGYGLGAGPVARALAAEGARTFFVAVASEGAAVRAAAPDARVFVFSGHMAGDAASLRGHGLIPLINSPEQWRRHREALPGHPFGVQVDTGMGRLGLQPSDWAALRGEMTGAALAMSHLACADAPDDPANDAQLRAFRAMTEGMGAPRSLAATGGTLLGPAFRFDLVRPGIGLYGGLPFGGAEPVVRLSVPVVQVRDVPEGAGVGYGMTWRARRPSRIATLSAGYADGLIRAMGNRARLWAGDRAVPLAGRVSMDLLTADVTDLPDVPEALEVLGPHQGVDALAEAAGTIGYEILTALGPRYARRIVGT